MLETINKMSFIASPSETNPFSRAGLQYCIHGVVKADEVRCHKLKQVHGTEFVRAQEGCTDLPEHLQKGDGLFSMTKGQVLAIKTADCLPVIIASRSKSFVSVIHAGWKGLAAGIVKRGLSLAMTYADKEDLFAFFGPCIGFGAFEVGPEVLSSFAEESFGLTQSQLTCAVHRGKHDRWHMDLAIIGAFELINFGISPENITILRSCTYSEPQLWNSFRRSGSPAPSNWTLAWI
ncbi:MAG: polyphenol oxidase family protein [Oligoflexales bacterium]